MMRSTTSAKVIKGVAVFASWIAVWQLVAMIVGTELLVPSPLSVLKAIISEIGSEKFHLSVLFSLLRVLGGFAAAVVTGAVLGFLTASVPLLNTLLSPLLKAVRAAPVASFIILALVWIKTDLLPAFISFLMGVPIVWEAVRDSAEKTDSELLEAARVFHFSRGKTFLLVTFPAVFPSLVSSAVTCLGFCWKSGIAAEVICLPKYSIGKGLYTAKQHLETEYVFAYTAVTVLLSIVIELLLRKIIARRRKSTKNEGGAKNGNRA